MSERCCKNCRQWEYPDEDGAGECNYAKTASLPFWIYTVVEEGANNTMADDGSDCLMFWQREKFNAPQS